MKLGDVFDINYHVSEKIYNGFIDIFEDKNPLHTDAAFARSSNFDDKVMHGAILAGFLSNFIGEKLPVKNVMVLSYKMAFSKPIYLNDQLQLKAAVTHVFASINCIDFKYTFENEKGIMVSKGDISIKII